MSTTGKAMQKKMKKVSYMSYKNALTIILKLLF